MPTDIHQLGYEWMGGVFKSHPIHVVPEAVRLSGIFFRRTDYLRVNQDPGTYMRSPGTTVRLG